MHEDGLYFKRSRLIVRLSKVPLLQMKNSDVQTKKHVDSATAK